ncbi:hypothetical protein HGM15179_018361 [Zosterops borbonicus]|uniref:Uncharacterized protein n=1 Tax=Zosterops borbonicus TaxID=364589 RepID=A0A8K1LCC7_9PASS|nr:hypothetical protein HGM15179_018361 [Zosterops borbonicus]
MAQVCPTLQDVLRHMTQAQDVSPPVPRQTESEPEAAQQLHSRGVVKDEKSGGAEGGTGLAQETEHKGGVQGGDKSEAAWSEAAQSKAARLPFFPVWGEPALTHTAMVAAGAATAETPAQLHRSTAAECPLPSDTESEASEVEGPASRPCSRQQSQGTVQYVTELQQIIAKLAKLSHQLETQTSAIPQPWAQGENNSLSSSPAVPSASSVFPSTQQVSLPAIPKNPIERRWAAAVKDAILDGDWQAASVVTCPVVINNGTGSWEPHEWEVLQQAKQTVTTYGVRSQAARNIIQYIFIADVLCPADSMRIASLLLTPSQLLIFERGWKRLAVEVANKHQVVGDPFYGLQPDMLTGQGPYATTNVQLTFPMEMHQLSQSLAHRTLLLVPDQKSQHPTPR